MLKVGTRVRVIADFDGNGFVPIGTETQIIAPLAHYPISNRFGVDSGAIYGYPIAYKCGVLDTVVICRPGELTPILPEGNQSISWDECIWQPEELVEVIK